jgi:uncharacterized protein YndB with AHSA1/START domain
MTGTSEAIVREIFIDASPGDVFPYFTDAAKMVVWKAVSAEIDGRLGGDFRIDVTGAGDVARGAFLEIDSPRRVVFTWAWEATIGLSDALPEGCRMHIGGIGPDGFAWRDISVWETPGQAKESMDGTLRPAIERAGATAIWGPPVTWTVHKLIV